MKRLASLLILTTVLACGDDVPSGPGTGGNGGAGGHGGSAGAQEFPLVGPYATVFEENDDFVYFFPEDLGAESTWPALVWFNGRSGYQDDFNYNGLLESVASWGFIVIGGKSMGMNPAESDQLTELLRRNDDPGDELSGRADEQRVAVAGHSLGGFQTTAASPGYRVAVAVQGASPPSPTMPEGAPTLFMTSEADDVVSADLVIAAYEAAVEDAWLANHATADHNDPRGDGGVYREPIVAFLRWKLHEDEGGEAWFVGDACVLCEAAEWSFDTR